MYAPAWKYGGVVRSTTLLCETLAQLGHQVTVVTTTAGTAHERACTPVADRRNGVAVIYAPYSRTPLGVDSPDLGPILDRAVREHDILHLTAVWQPTGRRAQIAAIRHDKPYIVSPRGALSPFSFSHGGWKKKPYWLLVERGITSAAALLHATAPLEEEELHRLLPCQRVATVPNAVDASLWTSSQAGREAWRAEHDLSPDDFVVMHVGRLEPKKNIAFLVEAMRLAVGQRRLTLAIIGSALKPAYEARLVSQLQGFPGRVIRVPDTPDAGALAAAYSAADAVALPSHHENFGNVLLESLLCGTPVVASKNVGAAFLTCDVPGTTVLPLDLTIWAEALVALHGGDADGCSTQRVSNETRAVLASRFSPHATAAGIARLYEDALRGD
jgi:glycosyltransferase involved in cell wall biosynthesis